ncbi:MAG: cytochrome c [Enterobacteriaceae bacterium]|jgi:mono/diheme cytochrome c family protein|nr:cytochrome c [Enterobacteriaceae bacterium]
MINRLIAVLCVSLLSSALCFADGVGTTGPAQFSQRSGESLYQSLCQACHMPAGAGAIGAGHYPSLANNGNLISSMFLANIIMYGQRGMPGFGEVLDDEQVTELVNYIRTHFGNHYQDKLTTDKVQLIRKPDYEYVDMN